MPLAAPNSAAIDRHHRAAFAWLLGQCRQLATHGRAAVVGLSAPQGAGKSTLAARCVPWFAEAGLTAVAVSIDDFYLDRAGQIALAAAHAGNPYLQQRGYPGTHDVALGARVLRQLRALGAGQTAAIPRYDKTAFGGLGDRAPADGWQTVRGPIDVVLVEGWMLGFAPVAAGAMADPALREANARLRGYRRWHRLIDALLVWQMAEPHYVVDWRVQAEAARVAQTGRGLTPEQARAYVDLFLPAYRLWAAAPPPSGQWARTVLGPDRLPQGPLP